MKDNPEFEYAPWAASYVEDLIGTTICFLHELIRTKQTVVPAPAATKDEMTELDEIGDKLQSDALAAVVDGGLAAVRNQSSKVPAAVRYSQVMMKMLGGNEMYDE